MAKSKDENAVRQRLDMWQERTERSNSAYESLRKTMDEREEIYRGRTDITDIIEDDAVK